MVKTSLVSTDIDLGSKIVQALDDSGLIPAVVLWANLAKYEDWRLLLASRKLDAAQLLDRYGLVHEALDRAGIPLEQTPSLIILRMNDPLIRELRKAFGKTKSAEGMRLGGQSFGGQFVEDAYVYRIK